MADDETLNGTFDLTNTGGAGEYSGGTTADERFMPNDRGEHTNDQESLDRVNDLQSRPVRPPEENPGADPRQPYTSSPLPWFK